MRSCASTFAKFDPAHLLDGLFVPVAKKGEALFDVTGTFRNRRGGPEIEITFEGVQLTALHQSLLLAIAARTALQPKCDAILVHGDANDVKSRQRELLNITGKASEMDVSIVTCSAYALMIDAGMSTGKSDYKAMIKALRQMATITMYRGSGSNGGTSHLLSFQHTGDQFVVSLNWRLADAIFGGQNIQISLYERRELSHSPVAKILHAWLSGHIRPGGQLMAGRGAEVDSLCRHVYGKRPCSEPVMRKRRQRIREALECISGLNGWAVRSEKNHIFVTRPKLVDEVYVCPGDLIELLDHISPDDV